MNLSSGTQRFVLGAVSVLFLAFGVGAVLSGIIWPSPIVVAGLPAIAIGGFNLVALWQGIDVKQGSSVGGTLLLPAVPLEPGERVLIHRPATYRLGEQPHIIDTQRANMGQAFFTTNRLLFVPYRVAGSGNAVTIARDELVSVALRPVRFFFALVPPSLLVRDRTGQTHVFKGANREFVQELAAGLPTSMDEGVFIVRFPASPPFSMLILVWAFDAAWAGSVLFLFNESPVLALIVVSPATFGAVIATVDWAIHRSHPVLVERMSQR